jgi:hypothetical protein
LDDEKLTKELWNMLKGTIQIEGRIEELIVGNHPKINTSPIQKGSEDLEWNLE